MSDLKEKIAAIKSTKYSFSTNEAKFFPIFKLRLEGLKEVNPQYFKDNETEMVKSTLAAQDMIKQGASYEDAGEIIQEQMNKACAKYELDNGADINPYLLTNMVGAFLRDEQEGILDRKGNFSDKLKIRTSEVLKVPHNAERNGKASDAVKIFGLDISDNRINKVKAALNKSRIQPMTLESSADELFPIFRLRIKGFKEIDPDYKQKEDNLIRVSLAVQDMIEQGSWFGDDLKTYSAMSQNAKQKYQLSDKDDEKIETLRMSLLLDIEDDKINMQGQILQPDKIRSSEVMYTAHVEDSTIFPVMATQTLQSVKSLVPSGVDNLSIRDK